MNEQDQIMSIERLIIEVNPIPAGSAPAGDSPRARQTLARVMPGSPAVGAPRRRPLLATAGLAAAAVAVAVAVAVTAITQSSRGAGPTQAAGHPRSALASALGALAAVAAAQPVLHSPGPGQFQYTDDTALNWVDTYKSAQVHFSVSYIERRQIWVAANGAGRLAESYSDPRFASPRDRAAWVAAGRPSLRIPPSDQRFGPHGLTLAPVDLSTLPTDPAKLARLLRAGKVEGGPHGPAEEFVQIGDLLRETNASPALRAALFKVAAGIPGARFLGKVTDQAGRTGLGIAVWHAFPHRGQVRGQVDESVLIFAPGTSALLGEQTLVTYAGTGKAVLTTWEVYLKSGVVDSVTSTTPVRGHGGTSGPA